MITSHPQIIGDIYNLEMDEFVKELIAYKWYPRFLGAYLPGDISQFKEVKRVVPSICFKYSDNNITHNRYYPRESVVEVSNEEEYTAAINRAASILKNSAELILKKWKSPAVSLTGGFDSTTTYAAFNGHYDQVESFTYQSAEKEVPDVEAAKIISSRFKTKHQTYIIPDEDSELKDFELKWAIITHNAGYISLRKKNEVRKRIYLEENCHNDVEVKSWVSEVTRARWYKHLRRSSMPPLSPKLFRSLYKIFLTNRSLAYRVEKIFERYISDYEYEKIVPLNYLPADMFMSEMIFGCWGGAGISEMKYIFDLTIPFNNKVYFDTMFKIPLKDRITDKHIARVKDVLNHELVEMDVRVVNMNDTVLRDSIQNLIFSANMLLPF
ncbi:MAG: asparagine synthase-related protein [Rikenellaceae bacterium]